MDALVERTLADILTALGVPFSGITHSTVAGQAVFSIETAESARLIGAHGDTIHALDMIVKKIVEKQLAVRSGEKSPPHPSPLPKGEGDQTLFLVDVNAYRIQKIKELESKALVMAERARSFQYDVELSPMSSYERLIVHTALAGTPGVKTESQGEGQGRRVVIKFVP